MAGLTNSLVAELERRLRRHPSGSVVGARRETVPITVDLPIAQGEQRLKAAAERLDQALDAAVQSLVAARTVATSGHAWCLRCASSNCEHAMPKPKQVFVGYNNTGLPRFEDYSQALLELGDERMTHLFGPSGRLVTRRWSEEELTSDLLPPFTEGGGYRLLGQVTAGWYWVPEAPEFSDVPRNFAVSFQAAMVRTEGQPHRLVLHAVGTSPVDERLEDLHDTMGGLPWEDAQRWCRSALGDVERALRKGGGTRRGGAGNATASHEGGEPWLVRVERILGGFERRLNRQKRAEGRRTRHAEDRRQQKRPTGHAVSDLAAASDTAVLRDTRSDAFVVLGERGRTHIFNESGRLVTSIQYSAEAIDKRRRSGRWRAAESENIRRLRDAVAG